MSLKAQEEAQKVAQRTEEMLKEVRRIAGAGENDVQAVFGLSESEASVADIVATRYRHLNLLIHPDKWGSLEKGAIDRAGGPEVVKAAFNKVQDLKVRILKDPTLLLSGMVPPPPAPWSAHAPAAPSSSAASQPSWGTPTPA